MRYLLMIYSDESIQMTPEQLQAGGASYNALTAEMKANGAYQAGERLQNTDTATTVRVRNGETLITDGPFAETKEQLGGFYMIDCESLDQALAYAAKTPTAARGSIEVRPIWELG